MLPLALRENFAASGERILVDHQRDALDAPLVVGREQVVNADRDHGGIFGAIGSIDRQHGTAVGNGPVVEDLPGERRPRISVG